VKGIVSFLNVGKHYPRSGAALENASFHIARGEFVFLAGHSGAGKSTVLRLMAMIERPTTGEVRVATFSSHGITPRTLPQLRRRLGIVFQDFRLLSDRTAEQNIAFALEVTDAPPDLISNRVARVLGQVGLISKGTAFPHELSGGEQQRVAIARALVNEPLVLLADEPTGNLDERATRSIYQLLRDINALGTTVVMATHDVALIGRSGQRFIELDHGRVVYDGLDLERLAADAQRWR
jgi:cell division transport system ATP-binding protein